MGITIRAPAGPGAAGTGSGRDGRQVATMRLAGSLPGPVAAPLDAVRSDRGTSVGDSIGAAAPHLERQRVSASSDAERLLERIVDGDDEALRELYRRYSRLAFSLAIRILRREDLAEDVVQEAFVRVWKNADRFDGSRAQFSTWFGRMVRNLCIDQLRRKDPLQRAGPLEDVEHWLSQSRPLDVPVLDRIVIREAFLRLPPEQSSVIELAYFAGLTHREIAERQEIPEGTVKSRMRLGMEKMRQHLTAPLPANGATQSFPGAVRGPAGRPGGGA